MAEIHILKISSEHFDAVITGSKLSEVRLNDRNYQKGDAVMLREYDDRYTGRRSGMFYISHILQDFEGLAPGYVCLSLRRAAI